MSRRRVAVIDRRRVLREAIAQMLDGTVSSVITSVADLPPADGSELILLGTTDEPPTERAGAEVRRFADDTPFHELLDAAGTGVPARAPVRAGDRPASAGLSLSPREHDVLREIADGRRTEDVAVRLGIGARTVENHKQRIFDKFGVSSRTEAVRAGIEHGLLRPVTAGGGTEPLRVVIAETSALLAGALFAVLDGIADVEVSVATSVDELLRGCRTRHPHVVLASTELASGDLASFAVEVQRSGARLLVLGERDTVEVITALLLAGASGYLDRRDCGIEQLVTAVRDVADGRAALHPAAAAAVLSQWRAAREGAPAPVEARGATLLTPREADVLAALARGLPTKTIGKELAVSPKTVEVHISRLLAKLNASNRAHAVSLARAEGLLE